MLVVRWGFSARFGKAEDCVAVLRKWEVDVGERVGWKLGSVRVSRGVLGTSDTDIEMESRCEDLSELEDTWSDMERAPHHREYLKLLEPLIVPGSSRWTVWREMSIKPKD